MAKAQKPFDKIVLIRGRLDMYVEYGEPALQGQSPQEFAAELRECFGYLMDLRNIINGMAALEDTPARAALAYVSDEDIEAVRGN